MTSPLKVQRDKSPGYLNELGATRLVVVDDEAHACSSATIRAHPPKQLKKPAYEKHADFAGEDGWQGWVDGQLEQLQTDGDVRLGDWQRTALRQHPEMASSPLDILALVFEDAYVPLTPVQWEALDATVLAAYAADALVLFDRDLKTDRTGDDLAQAFLEAHPLARVAIFTSTVQIGAAEIESAQQMAKEHPVLVASKAHLSDVGGMPRFIDELRLTAIAQHLIAVRARVLDLAGEAHAAAVSEVGLMELRLLEDVMIGSSRREGVFEADTLIRVLTVEYLHTLRERFLADDGAILDALLADLELARSRSPATRIVDTEAHKQATALMTRERYVQEQIINRPGLPLACGDVFADGDGRLWMLLEQVCDLQLRDDGDTRQSITHTQLVAVRAGKGGDRAWDLPPAATSFPHPHHLALKVRMTVSLDVLELAVFNRDGRCAWPVGAQAPAVTAQTPALTRRFNDIRKSMEPLAAARGDAPDEYLLRAGDLVGVSSDEELSWPLRRVERLHETWAFAALSVALADRGRPGLEHDLAE